EMLNIVKGELNVKEVEYSKVEVKGKEIKSQSNGNIFVSLDTHISEELKEEGLLNEVLRGLQVIRKESGCEVGEYVSIKYVTQSKELEELLRKYSEEIKKGILIKEMESVDTVKSELKVKVGDAQILVEILK
ncbi:MAG: Isoleucine-tRNA ligase, partial [candidate division WS6 bacterium GW2011_GWE1_34_7]